MAPSSFLHNLMKRAFEASSRLAFPIALAIPIALALPSPAGAQALDEWAPDLESLLNPKTTAATKRAQTAREAPASIVVLTDEDIRDRGYWDLLDVLRDLPGVSIAQHTFAEFGANRVNFRGIPGNSKLVLLLNGRRLGFASAPHPDVIMAHNFPLAMVKRLEIAYGPSSALYGTDAMSAVVNVVTKDGNDGTEGHVSTHYGLRGTADATLVYGAPLDVESSMMVMGRFFRTDGEDFDRFPQFQATAGDRAYWPGGASRDSSESSDTEMVSYRNRGFSVDLLRSTSNLPFATAGVDYRFAGTSESRWATSDHTLNLAYDGEVGDFQSATSLSYQNYTIDPNSMGLYNLRAGGERPESEADRAAYSRLYNYGQSRATRLEQTFIREFSPDLSVVAGGTLEDITGVPQMVDLSRPVDVSQAIDSESVGSQHLHMVEYQNYGVYMQTQLGFVPRLQTTLGARLDYDSRNSLTATPRLGLVYAATDATTIKALFGTAYLAPTIFERYRTFGGPGLFSGFENPNLRPQTSQTFELSAIHDLAKDLTLTGSLYQNSVFGLIHEVGAPDQVLEGQPTSGSWFANENDWRARGADAQLDGFVLGQRTFLNASLVHTEFLEAQGHEPEHLGHQHQVPGVVNAMLKGGLTWRPLDGLRITPRVWWLSGFTSRDTNAALKGAGTPAAWGLDLSARAELTARLALTLSATNLLDHAYDASVDAQSWYQGSQTPQPGRRLALGASYAF